jgi:DNA-binding transcriptional MerR regulator
LSKGMNLEQLRESLDTDAQKRCAEQEKTIKSLIEQNKRFAETIQDQQNTVRAIQNRCKALTGGIMCLFCDFKQDCKSR